MARGGINKALVHSARDALLARGLYPSIDLVRVELGNTGSKSTIQRYLKELNTPPAVDTASLPKVSEEMLSLVTSLAERLTQQAQEAVAEERTQLDRQQTRYHQEHAQLRERLDQALERICAQTTEIETQRQRERQLYEQLKDSEGERQRLLQLVAGQQQMLEERANHVKSLEEKHQHAREGLEHYRQEQLAQRGQELRRHEQQIHELRQELQTSQNSQMAKQEELVNVYREHERLLHESRRQQEQLRQHTKTIRDHQQTNDRLSEQVRQLLTEQALLRDRVNPYLLQCRNDRRHLRGQARQIETLQTLLRQLTPSA
ncbi:hypothetical protein DYL61_29455 [Pseudomonas nabeulensis]|uniref:KfrA N-terminal DNA-binding domain-containing protein n=1 Tax=Pseudomonas nabeulensis TaxID=2293833 RepID=A0A4Z0AGP0_9PSED|nr:DNA-binding protein [Pseudomonas nabeulensis]TFY85531.1 hypothetical protein DYL61_29455 [Pseudomonas nabeulensis]